MIKIIKEGRKTFITTCKTCGIVLTLMLCILCLTACKRDNVRDKVKEKMQEYCNEQNQTLLWIDETTGETTEGLSFKYIALLENNYNADMEMWLLDKDGNMVQISYFRR